MPKAKKPKTPRFNYHKELEASAVRKRQMVQLINRFDRLTRWVLVLHRRQHRIEFEYTIRDESTLYLRFRGPIVDRIDDRIFHAIDDRGDLGWWPQASSCKSDGVLQLEVRFGVHSFGMDTLRHELAWSLLSLLRRLPERSPAALTEIPLLNSQEIMSRMLAKMNDEYEQGATVYVHGLPINHLLDEPEQHPERRLINLRSPRIVRKLK
jgi:hypothetical protein